MKFKNPDLLFMTPDRVMALTRQNNVIFQKEDSDKYIELDWWEFKKLWEMHKWERRGEEKYVYDYIANAKLIIRAYGYNMSDCTFYWSKADEPLIIFVLDEYAIGIAPRLFPEKEEVISKNEKI